MMKNTFDIAKDIRSLINVPAVTEAITGSIWQFSMPNNRTGSDIVIKTLSATNEIIQQAYINVNVHAPNITGTTSAMADVAFFDNILNILLPLLDEQYKDSFSTEVDIPGDLIKDDDGTWFLLIRVLYRSYNNEYTNI